MVRSQQESEVVRGDGVEIETYVDGQGPAFVILPSYGRDGGEDYDAHALFPEQPAAVADAILPWAAGYRVGA